MVRSMTGYGRAQEQIEKWDITVEIKSVNHRFFEFLARVPRGLGYLEESLKRLSGEYISRGKCEMNVIIVNIGSSGAGVTINEKLAEEYLLALRSLCKPLSVSQEITLGDIARLPDIFAIKKAEENEEDVKSAVAKVAKEALKNFLNMRAREGERLKTDLLEKLNCIEKRLLFIEEQSPKTLAGYRERLTQKINEVLEDRSLDEGRIITEAAIFAERIAVDEETVRLRSHISQFRKILDSDESIGRKLDFLVQEINRESNTIGSKAQDLEIAKNVVEIKSDIEKIREQIQNIE